MIHYIAKIHSEDDRLFFAISLYLSHKEHYFQHLCNVWVHHIQQQYFVLCRMHLANSLKLLFLHHFLYAKDSNLFLLKDCQKNEIDDLL